jgi:hypothetical protein
MGAAEVIAFEEVRARKQWASLRQQLHERFDQWLDTLEQQWHELPATLPEVTATVWDLRQPLTGVSPRRSWRMSTVGNTTARRSPVQGVMGCCQPARASVVPSTLWWGRGSLSGAISIVGRVASAAIPSTKRWVWGRGANSSICTRPRRI